MAQENSKENKATGYRNDAEAGFHIAFGWLTALSVSIAAAALAAIS